MKKIILSFLCTLFTIYASAQFVATAEIKENIEGLCNKKKVYALLEMFGDQKEAVCAIQDSSIEKYLNDSVIFVKDKLDFKDKGMVSIIINCKGEVVQCIIDNKTKSPELDEQILNVFKTLKKWKAGKLNGKNVDSIKLWSFEISNGLFHLN